MRCFSLRQVWKWSVVCLIFLSAMHPSLNAKEQPELFYYLAVPSCPKNGECLFVACIQLDRQGVPVQSRAKNDASGAGSIFSIWRSSFWDEKAPDKSLRTPLDWKHSIEVKAERAIVRKSEFSQLPEPIRLLFLELEKLRCVSMQEIILQPLFQAEGFIGWQHVKHLNVLATATSTSAEERAKALLASLHEARETDPGKALAGNLALLHIKAQSVRYWPEYNVFLIEANEDFKEVAETLFSAMY